MYFRFFSSIDRYGQFSGSKMGVLDNSRLKAEFGMEKESLRTFARKFSGR